MTGDGDFAAVDYRGSGAVDAGSSCSVGAGLGWGRRGPSRRRPRPRPNLMWHRWLNPATPNLDRGSRSPAPRSRSGLIVSGRSKVTQTIVLLGGRRLALLRRSSRLEPRFGRTRAAAVASRVDSRPSRCRHCRGFRLTAPRHRDSAQVLPSACRLCRMKPSAASCRRA